MAEHYDKDRDSDREWGERGGEWERERRWAGPARREPYPEEWGPERRTPRLAPESPIEYTGRGDWGRQGAWGTFGNRASYAGGMGAYGGGIGSYARPWRFAGRGPRGWQRSDERIREDVNERLTDNPYIDATDIEVQVKDAEVTLAGSVEDRSAKRLAEDLAASVSGVKDVHNQLRLSR